jgi:hypothetical protein
MGLLELETFQHGVEIICENVVIIGIGGMAGLTEPTAIVRDYPITRFEKCKRLVFEHVAGQGPTVDQNDWVTCPDIFYVQLDAVFCLDESHKYFLCFVKTLNLGGTQFVPHRR